MALHAERAACPFRSFFRLRRFGREGLDDFPYDGRGDGGSYGDKARGCTFPDCGGYRDVRGHGGRRRNGGDDGRNLLRRRHFYYSKVEAWCHREPGGERREEVESANEGS